MKNNFMQLLCDCAIPQPKEIKVEMRTTENEKIKAENYYICEICKGLLKK